MNTKNCLFLTKTDQMSPGIWIVIEAILILQLKQKQRRIQHIAYYAEFGQCLYC